MILLACLALAQGGPVIDVEAGFDGQVFQDAWARITVVVQNPGESLEAPLRIEAGGIEPTQVFERTVSLPARSKKRFTWDVWLELGEHEVRVEIADASRAVPIVFAPGRRRAVHVGGRMAAFASTDDGRWAGVRVKPDLLPDALPPLLAADVVVFPEPVALEPEQEEALIRWVETGGRLVWSVGRGSPAIQRPFWREVCPAELGRPANVAVGGTTLPLVAATPKPGARTTIEVGGRPAGLRMARGRGDIHFLAFPADSEGIERAVPPAAIRLEEEPRRPAKAVEEALNPFDEDREWVYDARNLRGRLIRPDRLTLSWSGAATVGVGLYVVMIGPLAWRARRRGEVRGPKLFVGLTALACGGTIAWGALTGPPPRVVHRIFAEEGLVQTVSELRARAGAEYRAESEGAVAPMPGGAGLRPFARAWAPRNLDTGRVEIPLPRRAGCTLWTTRAPKPGELGVRAFRRAGTLEIRNDGRLSLRSPVLVDGAQVRALPDVGPSSAVTVVLAETPFVAFATWAGGDGEESPRRRSRFWERVGERELESLSLMRAFGTAVSSYRGFMGPRGIDMSPVLEAGGALVLAHFGEDVSGLRIEPRTEVETRGLLRVAVEDR